MTAPRVARRRKTPAPVERGRSAEPAAAPGPVLSATGASTRSVFAPLPYQRAWVADRSRFRIGLWARQTGKSTAVALDVVSDVLETESAGRTTTWVLLSRGERQSGELARKVRELARLVVEARRLLGQPPELIEMSGGASELRFPGGSRVIALPANPDTARGYSAHVVLDEFAFHVDSDAIWTALYPSITRGYRIAVLSTPNGQRGRYYQLWTEAMQRVGGWSAHRVTIHEAVEQGLGVDVDELRRGLRDELAWRQEYECEFADEAAAWLSWELIRAAEDPRATLSGDLGDAAGAIYMGWDVARWSDLSVLWAVERVGDVLWTRRVHVMRREPFEAQLTAVSAAIKSAAKCVRICVDATGLGEMPAEQLERRFSQRVERVKFTADTKAALASDLRRVIEDRRVRLPADEDVREDLHSVRAVTTAAGNRRFDGDGGRGGGHADRFWSLALAVHAADGGTVSPLRYQSAARRAMAAGVIG